MSFKNKQASLASLYNEIFFTNQGLELIFEAMSNINMVESVPRSAQNDMFWKVLALIVSHSVSKPTCTSL